MKSLFHFYLLFNTSALTLLNIGFFDIVFID
jgi:hypothetical protein